MTEPTDNELDIVLSKHWPAFATMGTLPLIWIRAAFREAIAKWGAPPAVVGEPVAWLSTDSIGERYLCFTKPKDSDSARPLVFGDTTPQPTQAQAGAVLLTPEAINAMAREYPAEDLCGWSYRMGVADAEAHHGIKGGQHGTE